jgi:hypothetical protein
MPSLYVCNYNLYDEAACLCCSDRARRRLVHGVFWKSLSILRTYCASPAEGPAAPLGDDFAHLLCWSGCTRRRLLHGESGCTLRQLLHGETFGEDFDFAHLLC